MSAPREESSSRPSRYESQKRRDWNTFLNYLQNYVPPLPLERCTGNHVVEFLKYLDQFGKTKVHVVGCIFFGRPNPPGPCACPLRQAWGSLDALVGRLRAAYEEHGHSHGHPDSNPFGGRPVRQYLRDVRDVQSRARGVSYHKKKRKQQQQQQQQLQQSASSGMAIEGSSHSVGAGPASSASASAAASSDPLALALEGIPDVSTMIHHHHHHHHHHMNPHRLS